MKPLLYLIGLVGMTTSVLRNLAAGDWLNAAAWALLFLGLCWLMLQDVEAQP